MDIPVQDKVMRIGELSRRSGISKQLIHYYLKKRYLHPPVYKSSNQAFYNHSHLDCLLFLKKCNEEAIPLSYAAAMWERKTAKDKKPRKTYSPGESSESKTREQIIHGASQIFLLKGYANTTIADIMESVGITKPSFYYYFKNKRDLYLTCLDSIFSTFSKRTLDMIRQERTPQGRLEQRWKAGHSHSRRLLISINLLKESFRQEGEEERKRAEDILRRSWVEPLARDIERGIKKGDFRELNSEIISFALVSMLDVFTYREILDQKYGSDVVLESVYDLILHGLLKR